MSSSLLPQIIAIHLTSFNAIGEKIGIRWKQRSVIGRGTFGQVVLAMNIQTRKLMAVKEIDFTSLNEPLKAVQIFDPISKN